MAESAVVMMSDSGGRNRPDDAPSTRAALIAAGTTAVVGAVLAGLISVIPQITEAWQIPAVLAVASLFLIPSVLYLRRSVRVFLYHDPTREITKYTYNPERGILQKGAIPNVSLRVATLHSIIDRLAATLPESDCKRALYDAGSFAGTSWAKDFLNEYSLMGTADRKGDYPELYVQWAHYDGSAGLGRLTVAVSPEKSTGTVLLSNSFLSTRDAKYPLNHWFSGYIAGTLNQLWAVDELGKHKIVEVELCSPQSKAHAITIFDVTVKERPSNRRTVSLRSSTRQGV